MDSYEIEGIHLDIPSSRQDMVMKFSEMLQLKTRQTISFINPEIFFQANKDSTLKEFLVHTKYNFIDGNGLLMAINKYFKSAKYTADYRYPGTDFFQYLPSDRITTVFLFGAKPENNLQAKKNIEKRYSYIKVVGNLNGYSKLPNAEIVEKINATNPDILIVCFGCPRQEEWITENATKLNVKIVFGNGGAIDFWSESVKRAPQFFIRHRLEWLYRLVQDFNIARIKRQSKLVPFAIKSGLKRYEIIKLKTEE